MCIVVVVVAFWGTGVVVVRYIISRVINNITIIITAINCIVAITIVTSGCSVCNNIVIICYRRSCCGRLMVVDWQWLMVTMVIVMVVMIVVMVLVVVMVMVVGVVICLDANSMFSC